MEYVVIYDTSTNIAFIANFPGSNAVTQVRKTRHSYDAVIVGRRFLPRKIPTHTRANTIAKWEIKTNYIMKIPQSQTE